MTTDLEKQFFDTFGIEKIIPCYKCSMQNTNWNCKRSCLHDSEKEKRYPTITDRILLNLILIMNPYAPPVGDTMEEMKEQVLYWCIRYATDIKHQVRTLFEEG